LTGLAAIGFIAVIYIPAGWAETLVLVLAIGCGLAGLVGYGMKWKARRAKRVDSN
jgi:hypothetical protein